MSRLFIAEKPAVAAAIAEAMGGGSRREGFIQVGQDRITWCIGHLLRLKEPHEYDEALSQMATGRPAIGSGAVANGAIGRQGRTGATEERHWFAEGSL
ncbi:toprim domain-containing protein [Pseudomonas sp. JG-B]|uniref:toprim domain-containing protein n=1 Tax=Pseudomonas sp. JG-B TaxID=2603214 RepID=UPI00129E2B7B|nr:toprim domain-containing protein [Pseudomonas sp. JG-B]MRK19104.1 hypothetical protein [Pseudomonas sp. JG-B]